MSSPQADPPVPVADEKKPAAEEGGEAAKAGALKRKREREEEVLMKEKERKIVMRCGADGKPAVAGAEGAKNGTTHVGATCLWLVCDEINRCIGRLERLGGVTTLQKWLDEDAAAKEALLASHKAYQAYVTAHVLPEDKVATFLKMHCQDGPQRKHGNAGTTNAVVAKCLHAHTATFLSTVPNPVGRVVYLALQAASSLSDEVDADKLFADAIAAAAAAPDAALTEEDVGRFAAHCEQLLPTFGGTAKSGGRRKKKRLH
eukprot:TRINITY_DN9912_c0_g1_i2.p1 TRINITY_DN9912_c0_g1~~TRINITY_DN9912_c0_g1_i2.p1  ORF type:complete len:259 (+),score=102.51 TRINITY_DN9912_c0_g1_i2:42-818(+)